MTRSIDLDKVFSPSSVAVVGASAEKQRFSFANNVMLALIEAGFPAIYPVNPKYSEAFGLPCYPSIAAIPGPVDHVVVCIPAEKTLELLADCSRKHVNSVHFFSAGYRESGQVDGAKLEQKMLLMAREGGFSIIGPNCTGLIIPGIRFITGTHLPKKSGPVAFLSQSGGHAMDLPVHAGHRGIWFSKVISYGNALDIDESDLLEYLGSDPETKIIAAYIEGVKDGARFRSVLQKVADEKPVVICKGGTGRAGLRAAVGHTASLTSSVETFRALCRQTNAILVDDIRELTDMMVALSYARPYASGRNVAVLGAGGGPSVEAGDRLESAGLQLPAFSEHVQSDLGIFLQRTGSIFTNPLDAARLLIPDAIYRALKVLGNDPGIDMMLYHMGFHPSTRWGDGRFSSSHFLERAEDAFCRARDECKKPVMLSLLPAFDAAGMQEYLKVQEAFVKAGLPVFRSFEKAGIAMARFVQWRRRFAGRLPG